MRKPFTASAEFWLGVATVFFAALILLGFGLMFAG